MVREANFEPLDNQATTSTNAGLSVGTGFVWAVDRYVEILA
jgi:hypothetical protein